MTRLIITKSIKDFTCSIEDNLDEVINKLSKQAGLPLIVINNKGYLKGVISNGDILRHFKNKKFFPELKACNLMNKFPVYLNEDSPKESLEKILGNKVRVVPIVNELNIVKKIGYLGPKSFKIGKKDINEDNNEIYLIAEIGVNHCGNEAIAKELIKSASEANFDAVKFQFRDDDLLDKRSEDEFDLSSQYIKDELNRVELNQITENNLIEYSKDLNLDVIITPFTESALERALKLEIDGLKIASCDLSNLPLLKNAASTGLPMIISTGMSFEHEILKANEIISELNSNTVFLHCNSTYPAPPEDLNLSYLRRLEKITENIVGYSSHDGIQHYCYVSIGYQARIIEVHITISRDNEGTDHKASLECLELKDFTKTCKQIALANGSDKPRTPSQGELANRNVLSKSLTYKDNFKKGYLLQEADVSLRSPGDGIPFNKLNKIIGKKLNKDVKMHHQIRLKDIGIKENYIKENQIPKFNFPKSNWGIPVRYRDFNSMHKYFNPPIFEFHMSDKDTLLNPSKYLPSELNSKLVVHAIEQYSDGFILNLCSLDEDTRLESVKRLKSLIEHSYKLFEFFPNSSSLKMIVNIGGFTSYKFAEKSEIESMFLKLNKSFQEIGYLPEIDILPQTMPPFPWHQGGRSFHNVCTSVESIKKVTSIFESKFCLDISHTYLWCNYSEYPFEKFIEETKHLISHLHIADAHNNSEEGLNIGNGSINFEKILPLLKDDSLTWIVETWQGHLNEGRGFASSLEQLSDMMI